MRLHTNRLNRSDVRTATAGLPGVYVTVTEHGSRSHARAFEVRLEGNGMQRNSGSYGADTSEQAATWDEWGVFFARLYDIDAGMVAGSVKHPAYANALDYHQKTCNRFTGLVLPADTHKRHNWVPGDVPRVSKCNKCSATRRY